VDRNELRHSRFTALPSPRLGVFVKRRCDFGADGKCLVSGPSANPDTKCTSCFAVFSTVYGTGSVRPRYGRETPPVAGATPGSRGSRGEGYLPRSFLLGAGRALSGASDLSAALRVAAHVREPVCRSRDQAARDCPVHGPRERHDDADGLHAPDQYRRPLGQHGGAWCNGE
jgi:hypothetical protein